MPAGRYLSPEALEALEALEVPLIVDEQRAAYPLEATPRRARGSGATMFVVDGLSALPEAQLAWIAASGPAPLVKDAVARLARARPPLAALMARALPALLAIEPRRAVRERAAQNLAMLRALLSGSPLRLPEVEAGGTLRCGSRRARASKSRRSGCSSEACSSRRAPATTSPTARPGSSSAS
ncbi:MAG: hypothetical protein M5U28_27830 [Sandaracinaceae bacterium]|nr:hypothetical protein [Sandaracinaceae bacterium]